MTDQQHPITPPPELVQEWESSWRKTKHTYKNYNDYIATQAARWGADQELEACCEWVEGYAECGIPLRVARRPKPPSLKESALEALEHILRHSSTELGAETIRRALEKLDD